MTTHYPLCGLRDLVGHRFVALGPPRRARSGRIVVDALLLSGGPVRPRRVTMPAWALPIAPTSASTAGLGR